MPLGRQKAFHNAKQNFTLHANRSLSHGPISEPGGVEGFFIQMKDCINNQILFALSNLGALAAKTWEIDEKKIDRELVRELNEIARQVKHSLKIIEEVTQ